MLIWIDSEGGQMNHDLVFVIFRSKLVWPVSCIEGALSCLHPFVARPHHDILVCALTCAALSACFTTTTDWTSPRGLPTTSSMASTLIAVSDLPFILQWVLLYLARNVLKGNMSIQFVAL